LAIDASTAYGGTAVPAEANQKDLEQIAGIFAGDTDYSVQKTSANLQLPKPAGGQNVRTLVCFKKITDFLKFFKL
jgi:hypothetical protein